jgi:signal transduction histidine kinase
MRTIKLLNLTSLGYLLIFGLLTVGFYSAFFFIVQKAVAESTDEALYNRKQRILTEITKNGNKLPNDAFHFTDFRLSKVPINCRAKDVLSDTAIYEKGEEDSYDFKKLTSIVQIGRKNYRLEIVVPQMEKEAIVSSITKTISLVLVLMVFTFVIATLFFSRALWQPFHRTLSELDEFQVEGKQKLDIVASRIAEFDKLNRSIIHLTLRARATFENQKQFIENASHELQTPLSINQYKLEQLIDDPDLTHKQSGIVQSLIDSNQRMARLNKTLLLLAKIENGQFPETESVNIKALTADIIKRFEDIQTALGISVDISNTEENQLLGNKMLIDLLLSNLIKNAFVHNIARGKIIIVIRKSSFAISNSSDVAEIPSEKLFERFYKNSNRTESWGLGLALVLRVCRLNGWEIHYSYANRMHSFQAGFS